MKRQPTRTRIVFTHPTISIRDCTQGGNIYYSALRQRTRDLACAKCSSIALVFDNFAVVVEIIRWLLFFLKLQTTGARHPFRLARGQQQSLKFVQTNGGSVQQTHGDQAYIHCERREDQKRLTLRLEQFCLRTVSSQVAQDSYEARVQVQANDARFLQ